MKAVATGMKSTGLSTKHRKGKLNGTTCKLPKGQKASERAKKNAEDAGCELGEDETYHVAYPKRVRCKKKNEE